MCQGPRGQGRLGLHLLSPDQPHAQGALRLGCSWTSGRVPAQTVEPARSHPGSPEAGQGPFSEVLRHPTPPPRPAELGDQPPLERSKVMCGRRRGLGSA